MILKPGTVRYISLLLAAILSLPIPLGIFTGFYLWTSPFILLNSVLALKTVVLFSIFGFAILALILYKDLWFCRYWCPTGVICDSVSKTVRKGNSNWKLPFIHKQLVVISLALALFGFPVLLILDPVNIFYNFFNVFNFDVSAANVLRISGLLCIVLLNLLFPHSWCDRICPLKGLQLFITDAKRLFKTQKTIAGYNFNRSRRYFISGIIGIGSALTLREFSAGAAMPVFRPPGALPEHQYKTVCARCGNCIQACPVDIIKSSFGSNDLLGILIPELDFSQGYCLPECSLCGDVCPSGAITNFTLEQKRQLYIGTVQIDLNKCLLVHNKECDRCKFFCAYDAIDIKSSDSDFTASPQVIAERCVGCAACKIACPPGAIKISVFIGKRL